MPNPKGTVKNLKKGDGKNYGFTKDTAQIHGRAGGLATARIKKAEIDLAKQFKKILSMPIDVEKVGMMVSATRDKDTDERVMGDFGLLLMDALGDQASGAAIATVGQFLHYVKTGDPRMGTFIRDQIGQKPPEPIPDDKTTILASFVKVLDARKKDMDLTDADAEGGHIDNPP